MRWTPRDHGACIHSSRLSARNVIAPEGTEVGDPYMDLGRSLGRRSKEVRGGQKPNRQFTILTRGVSRGVVPNGVVINSS